MIPTIIMGKLLVCTALLLAFAALAVKAQVCDTCGPEYGEDDFDDESDDYDYWRSKRGVEEEGALGESSPVDVEAVGESVVEHFRVKRAFLSCEDCKKRCICKGKHGKGLKKIKQPQCTKDKRCKCKKGKRKSKPGHPSTCD